MCKLQNNLIISIRFLQKGKRTGRSLVAWLPAPGWDFSCRRSRTRILSFAPGLSSTDRATHTTERVIAREREINGLK